MPHYRVSRLYSLAWLLSLLHLAHPPRVISQPLDSSSTSTFGYYPGYRLRLCRFARPVQRLYREQQLSDGRQLRCRLQGISYTVFGRVHLRAGGQIDVCRRTSPNLAIGHYRPASTAQDRRGGTLHLGLNLQTLAVAVNRCGREDFLTPDELHRAVPRSDVAVNLETVPSLGVPYVIDGHVVVLAPEEGHRIERDLLAKHVARGSLALSLRHHPVLHPDALTGMRIGPARDVTGREQVRCAGLQELIDGHAPVQGQSGPLGQLQVGSHPNAGDNQVGLQAIAVVQHHLARRNFLCGLPKVEVHSVLLVKFLDEVSQFGAHHPLQWTSV